MRIWALDTETSGLHPDDGAEVVLLAAATRWRGKLRAWAWPNPFSTHNPEWPKLHPDRWIALCHRFGGPDQQLVFHNAKFDLLHMTYAMRGLIQSFDGSLRGLATAWQESTVWDTMIVHKLLEGEHSAGLKPIARRLWGDGAAEPADEIEAWFVSHRQKARPRYGELPWPLISRYACQDVKLTYRLMEWQQEKIEDAHDWRLRRLVYREHEFMKLLLQMELRGIQFDSEAAMETREWLLEERARLIRRLPFRPTLPAAKDFFFGKGVIQWTDPTDPTGRVRRIRKRELVPVNTTKTGAPALAERDVDTLAKSGVPFASRFWREQALKSMVAKWYDPWPRMAGADGRLRPTFSLTKVRSHRLSAERVQLHAIPHIRHFQALDLPDWVTLPRRLFTARSRHQLWEVDLAQGEVRIAAAVTQCAEMIDIVSRPGSDPHSETTKAVFHIDESDPNWKSRRDVAKRVTFGVIYGAGARKLSETIFLETGIEISESETRSIVFRYRNVFPEFFQFSRLAERECQARGYVTLVSGKRRYFQFGEPLWESPHTAFNAIIQGGLAETMRDVMLRVEKRWPGTLLLQIHDSIVLELPRSNGHEIAEKIRQVMIDTYQEQFGVVFGAEAELWENKA